MTEKKVHHLKVVPTAERRVRTDTVAALETALEAAKKGEITEVVILAKCPEDMPDGLRWREIASGVVDFCQWLGRLEIMKAGWIDQYRMDFEEVDDEELDGDGEDSDE